MNRKFQYKEQREPFEARFKQYSKIADSEKEFISPSGLYKLETSIYGKGEEVCWKYSRGIVTEISSGKILADVKRNIGHFWHSWVKHPNGNEYLLCGEDYQGYSVVNLTKETYQVYFPEEGYKGFGFCWTAYPKYLVDFGEAIAFACFEEAYAPERDFSSAMIGEQNLCAYQYFDSPWLKSYEPWIEHISFPNKPASTFHYLIFGGDNNIEIITTNNPTIEVIEEKTTVKIEYEV